MDTNPEEPNGPVDAYTARIPDHECIGEGCPHPAGFFFVAVKNEEDPDPGAFLRLSGVHNIPAQTMVAALVALVDSIFQENRGETPPMIAFGQGRALIRETTDGLNPPGEVLADAGEYMAHLDWDLS